MVDDMTSTPLGRDFFERLPKVELHVHLEGSIPPSTMRALAEKRGRDLDRDARWALLQGGRYKDFSEFVQVWTLISELLREYRDYEIIARALAGEMVRQNIRHAEVLFSPTLDSVKHLDPVGIAAAAASGFQAEGEQLSVRLIADIVRDNGPAEAQALVEALAAGRPPLLAGIGIGGSENRFPPEPFAAAFQKARAAGFRTEAHAGETAGPDSIWGALRTLRVERINHGTRAREDAFLLRSLRERRIPVASCPTSNLRLAVVPRLEEHPVGPFLADGLAVNLATDDPAVFGADLAGEYAAAAAAFGWNQEDIRRLLHNALEAAWCGEDVKSRLRSEIDGFLASA